MGKKGENKHLKRKAAPRFWPIHRKEYVWTVKPKTGPHSLPESLPLTIILRDILSFTKTRKEAKTIISNGKVYINGKCCRDDKHPVGLMDVISIPDAKVTYRVLSHNKGLILHPIKNDEATISLCRIEDKTVVKNGHVQLHFHNGANRLIRVADPAHTKEDIYSTLDVIRVNIPDGQIVGQIKPAKGSTSLITGGKNRGRNGKIIEIETALGKKRRSLLATIEDAAGTRFQTILDYIFVVGNQEYPPISLPEVR